MAKLIMDEKTLCRYIEKWYAARYKDWDDLFYIIHRNREYGIYKIPNGNKILDVLIAVHGEFMEHFAAKDIIPVCFSSPHQLLVFLANYRAYCQEKLTWIADMPLEFLVHNEVESIMRMLEDVIEMATYCIDSYKVSIVDDSYRKPYVKMKQCLENGDIDAFMQEINVILNDIPYSIYRDAESEGRYHSIIHAIMFQLGFKVISEKTTTLGRLDMLVEMQKYVYIFEFKYSKDGRNLSEDAIRQIKDKGYGLSYCNSNRKVWAVGVTLGGDRKNAFDWRMEVLN